MKRIFYLILYLIIGVSCSSDDKFTENSNIQPPNFIIGTWISSSSDPAFDGTIKYTFTPNNLTEEGVFEKNNGEPFKVDYKALFSSDEFTIEEEIKDNSYKLSISYKSGEISFFEDTNFNIPITRTFVLVSENMLSAPYPISNLALIKQ